MSTDNCTIDLGCKVRNPLFHSGTSQRERLLAALNPDYIKADEHSLEDLLIFASEYAAKLNYYNGENITEGNWQALIDSDPTIILARVSLTKISQIKIDFEDKVKHLLSKYGSRLDNLSDLEKFREVFGEIMVSVKLLNGWYELQSGSNPLRPVVGEFITQRLGEQVKRLISYDKGAVIHKDPHGDSDPLPAENYNDVHILAYEDYLDDTYGGLDPIWGIADPNSDTIPGDSSIYVGINEKNQVDNGINEVRLVFNVILQAIGQIISMSEALLAQSLQSPDHKPHIGLFITFLRLFRFAQDDLNKFTKKHLDYYYKEVLRLAEKEALPDRVFLIFELAQNVEQHLISVGTEFEAGEDALGNEVTFDSIRDVVLNKGTISALNTVFAEHDNNSNPLLAKATNIYSAAGANTKNGLGEELLKEGKFWPLLGETQTGIAEEDRTMQDASIGFALASPIFFLKSGTRRITINLSSVNSPEIAPSDLDSLDGDILNSLRVSLTSTKDFIIKKPSKVSTVTAPIANTDKYSIVSIQIEILLNKEDLEVTAYDASVHGGTFETNWPLLKFIFDNKEASIDSYGIQKYSSATKYFPLTGKDHPYNSYVLSNGNIYKLIGTSSDGYTGYDPETTSVWEKIENVEDLVADLNSSSINYVADNVYKLNDIAKINGQLNLAGEDQGKIVWAPISDKSSYAYKHLEDINIQNIQLTVNVTGISDIILHSEDAALDPNKPFTPFGSNPDIGSHFYLGNTEIFQKQLTSLKLNLVWDKLPEENFGDYYFEYATGFTDDDQFNDPKNKFLNNASFTLNAEILDNGVWTSLFTENQSLFNTDGNDPSVGPPLAIKPLLMNGPALENIKRDPYMIPFDAFKQGLSKGFVRFVLQKTSVTLKEGQKNPLRAFGHRERPLLFTERIINKSTGKKPSVLPKEPYTPLVKECSVDYESTVTIQVTSTNTIDFKNRVDKFFHIQAFGQNEVHRQLLKEEEVIINSVPQLNFLPQYNDDGTLYIGLQNIAPLQNITLLFQFKEGTEDTSIEFPELHWSYLTQNRWQAIPAVNLVYDGTNKFHRSGIVEISLPEEMTNQNTLLPSGSYWLRLSAQNHTTALNKVLTVAAQTLEVDFVNNGNDPERVRKGLPAKVIQDLKSRDAEIDTISQPFASFGGKVKEESTFFYNRVSERLRHKSRAIEIWDYERLVLENFQDIYRTKCLNHTSTIKAITTNNLEDLLATEANPGFVTMVVIPQLRDFITQEIFEPKAGIATIADIKDYLLQYVSPFVQLEVENALYERVKAQFEVVFMPGLDKAFYSAKLNEDINQFLAPWAFDSTRDITFGGRLQRSVLINFIEERPYVDFVLHFHLLQQSCIGSDTYMEVDEAQARTSRSVLSSAGSHLITALDKDQVVCDDGIGSMIVQTSFVVR